MMETARPDKSLSLELSIRMLRDLGRQNLTSTGIYLVLWIAISALTRLPDFAPRFFAINTVILLLVTVSRLWLWYDMRTFAIARFRIIEIQLVSNTLLNAAHWGVMLALSFTVQGLQPLQLPLMLTVTGVVGAGTWAVAFHPLTRFYLPIFAIAPGILAMALNPEPQARMFVALAVLYLGYVLVATRVRQQDYLLAIHNSAELEQRTRELEYLSFTDPVTRLHNRAYFDMHLDLEWKRAERQQYPVSLLLVDLDHFKSINDRYGHPFGDHVLEEVGLCITDIVQRSGDIVARIGGEEFALVLINTSFEGATRVAQEAIDAVAALELRHDSGTVHITTSVGVATTVPDSMEPNAARNLLRHADIALYAAKDAGRNCWRAYPLASDTSAATA